MLRVLGWILLGLLGLMLLVLLTPVSVRAKYADSLEVWLGLGPVKLRAFPLKKRQNRKKQPKKEKKTKEKKAKQKPETEKAAKKPALKIETPTLDQLPDYLRLGADALGSMRRRILVREFRLSLTLGGDNAAKTALNYGRVAALFSLLGPLLDRAVRVRRKDVSVEADFSGGPNRAAGEIEIAACPLRLVIAGLKLLFAFLALQRKTAREKTNDNETKGGNEHEQYSGRHEAHHGEAA